MNWEYFWLNFGTLNMFPASKLTELWLFLVQNSNGRGGGGGGGLSFCATPSKFSKIYIIFEDVEIMLY